MNEPMTLERFAALLDAYGASERRWPDSERAPALALLAASAKARAMRSDARRLDHLLDRWLVADPVPTLRAAVLASTPARSDATSSVPAALPRGGGRAAVALWASIGGWRPATALAAALVLGLVSGGVLLHGPAEEIRVDIARLALFDDHFAGY